MESENCACGGAVDGTSGCCEKCKKSTSEDKTRPVMAGLCCPECDTVALQKTAKFCSECGHKFKIEKLDASLKTNSQQNTDEPVTGNGAVSGNSKRKIEGCENQNKPKKGKHEDSTPENSALESEANSTAAMSIVAGEQVFNDNSEVIAVQEESKQIEVSKQGSNTGNVMEVAENTSSNKEEKGEEQLSVTHQPSPEPSSCIEGSEVHEKTLPEETSDEVTGKPEDLKKDTWQSKEHNRESQQNSGNYIAGKGQTKAAFNNQKKTLLETANEHPLDLEDNATEEEVPLPHGGSETLEQTSPMADTQTDEKKRTEKDGDESSDDSSVEDGTEKATKPTRGQSDKKKGKTKQREKKAERKARRTEEKRQQSAPDLERKMEKVSLSSNDNKSQTLVEIDAHQKTGKERSESVGSGKNKKSGQNSQCKSTESQENASTTVSKQESGHDYNLRERKAKEVERRFTHGTGDQHELQVHFYALLDPAFGGSENMYIVFGRPIGDWLQGSRIPVKSCGKFAEFEILHGILYLPSVYKSDYMSVPYKYIKVVDKEVIWEFIRRPVVHDQGIVNRLLIIKDAEWRGQFDKFDSIVSPLMKDKGFWTKTVRYFTGGGPPQQVNKTVEDEFLLCLRTFLPSWQGFEVDRIDKSVFMEDAINRTKHILCSLHEMSFTIPNSNYGRQRFNSFSIEGKLKIFMDVFGVKIEDNYSIMAEKKPGDIKHVLLSTVALSHILIFIVGNEKISSFLLKKVLKLIDCFSLTGLRNHDATSEEVAQIVRELTALSIPLLQDLTASLETFLVQILEHREIVKETSAWWSILSLISMLNNIAKKESDFKHVEGMLTKLAKGAISEKDKDIKEIETALYYTPDLQPLVLSMFCIENHDAVLKIKGIDSLELLKKTRQLIKQFMSKDEIQKITSILVILKSRIHGESGDIVWIVEGIRTTQNLFDLCHKSIDFIEHASVYDELIKLLDSFMRRAEQNVTENQSALEKVLETFEKGLENMTRKMTGYFRNNSYIKFKDACQFVDLFFKMKLGVDCFKKSMDESAEQVLNLIIQQKMKFSRHQAELLEVICSADKNERSERMMKSFDDTLKNIIDNFEDHTLLLRWLPNSEKSEFLWRLCDKVFSNEGSTLKMMRQFLEWPTAASFIKLSEKLSKTTGDQGHYKLIKAMSHFQKFEDKLINGDITSEELEIITTNKDKFCEISSTLKHFSSSKAEDNAKTLTTAVTQRNDEIDFIKNQVEKVWILRKHLSENFQVDLTELDTALQKAWFQTPMSQLCKRENEKIKDLMFNLPGIVEENLEMICYGFTSIIFRKTWNLTGQKIGEIVLSDIIETVVEPVKKKLSKMMCSLLDGSITLGKVGRVFEKFRDDNEPGYIIKEITILIPILHDENGEPLRNKNLAIDSTANKICNFFKLQRNRKKAASIIKLGKSLNLKGSFQVFEEIKTETEINMNQEQLRSLSDTHFKAAVALQNVTAEMIDCIDSILRCLNLIRWLREELKDLRDVKTFVDLLSISAGESDFEADRVSCLHTVCLEFEPIIFKLDAKAGPVELIECCEIVLEKVKKDPTLINKMVDSNRLLEWFKNERKSYGSVATSSMMEAEAVNRRGYYIIGSSETFDVQKSVHTMENSLHLYVPEKTNSGDQSEQSSSGSTENVKVYKLIEIGDLQSKLMLIGGQQGKEKEMGQIEKDCFLQMFETVARVTNLFIQLCNAGCVEYLTWSKQIHCNLGDGNDAFRETIASVEEQCIKLQEDLDNWKRELDNKRTQFPHLNYFTVRQLLMLQSKLRDVILNEDLTALRDLPAQIYSLLDEVYPEIDETIFRIVLLKSSYHRRYGERSSSDDSWKKILISDDKFIGVSFSTLENFIASLEEEGHDEDVAKAATMHCGISDRAKASAWGYNNNKKEELISGLAEEMDGVLERKEEDASRPTTESEVDIDMGVASADQAEQKKEVDYLTLEELGKVLEELSKERKKKRAKMKLIETMNKRKPNLMTVPRDDLLRVVIDIYKQAGDRLPSSGEVEICNNDTSLEKIELLFRRALIDPDGIYTLAFIEELNYNIAVEAFRKLEVLLNENASKGQGNTSCNLLLVCSSEREDGSFLASAWDDYRIVSHRCPSSQETREFLTKRLMFDKIYGSNVVHAASADEDSSTVRVIKSHTAGTGKSLCIKRTGEKLEAMIGNSNLASKQINGSVDTEVIVTTSLQGRGVNQDEVVEKLIPFDKKKKDAFPRIYHFDIASTVTSNLDSFLFQLLIVGSVSTSTGSIWKKKPTDLYLVEITEAILHTDSETVEEKKRKTTNAGNIIPLLPTTVCRTPRETWSNLKGNQQIHPGFDEKEFESDPYQRVYECLQLFVSNPMLADRFVFQSGINRNPEDCLKVLLRYCGVEDPSWREIKHFVHFFNNQLCDCDNSIFCNSLLVGDTLPGFKAFVVKFMLQMSKDFATPSVNEESEEQNEGLVILRRRWEKSEHPYLFFNQDRQSMSFLGFTVNTYGDLMDKENRKLIEKGIMTPQLYQGLRLNGVELFSQYDKWDRMQKLKILCQVMGIEDVYDPDSTYELTFDNMMKILAIHMRFRSGIPVIIMGETGCGKTRLIRFMCKLKAGPNGPQNMLLVKVHGGITEKDIERKVSKAIELAQTNRAKRRMLETVLFFDEANTTSAVGLIKEIMCDKRMAGKPLSLESCGLQIIAACNPYRKHTDEMIAKLESAGLGYHVKSEDAAEKLGRIPLRQLVYRVHQLPESMLPLVWDFGQLSNEAEILYAAQIVHRYARKNEIPNDEEFINVVIMTLGASQLFMRQQKDECSFVSLRDVERAVQVLVWFYSKMDRFYPLIEKTKEELRPTDNDDDDDSSEEGDEDSEEVIDVKIEKIKLSLILALSVCYAARLEKRNKYYRKVASKFIGKYQLEDGHKQMIDETKFCQQMFLDQLQLGDNIAKNTALSENVFMMVVCIELRIPLFVVGKPGSSKSLAKTIIQDNMQGTLSHSDLFKEFKQILMCSYQCSPLSTAEGIIAVFKQCSRFQEGKDLNTFASVVVLDEVGLAEDSPRMPLKALHPLLEDGTDGSEDLTAEGTESKDKRVAFIGISNWALDPAKMNRGLMLTRGEPDEDELIRSADGICSSNPFIKETISGLFRHLAKAYLKIYKEQRNCEKLKTSKKEEFFGLRDYYSLIKMIFNRARAEQRFPRLNELEHAVKRNFGGLEDFDTWKFFFEELRCLSLQSEATNYVDVSPVGLLKSCLQKEDSKKDTRYVLLMTENFAALRVLEKKFPEENADASVIFGSSFPKDQEFTQICRDINKIKVCMETGMTVILLNMENLYESLYDALNQYYVYLGGQRYVDLGLGTHRVKCRVHEDFKLIVVAEKKTVYESFPIPLINRLEKHFLVMSTSLTDRQMDLRDELSHWAKEFSTFKHGRKQYTVGDSFIGYKDDTPASVLLETMHDLDDDADDNMIIEESKRKLLNVATPEAVTRVRKTPLNVDADMLWNVYFREQDHDSLQSLLQSVLSGRKTGMNICLQVTTFSRLLSPRDQSSLERAIGDSVHIKNISLNQFQTEQQFSEELRRYIKQDIKKEKMLILQCDNGDENSDLIALARHLCHQSKLIHADYLKAAFHIIFIVNLRRVAHGCQKLGSFHGVNWLCVHIDELRPPSDDLPSLIRYANQKMSSIFRQFAGVSPEPVDMETETGSDMGSSETRMAVDSSASPSNEEEAVGADDAPMELDSNINEAGEIPSAGFPDTLMVDDNRRGADSEYAGGNELKLLLGMLRRSVQPSIVRTVTSNNQVERLTKRIHLLLDLFSPNQQDSDFGLQFATVLLRIIYSFLEEKESHALEDQEWFYDEAVTGNNIQECGTFRRALSYRIEREIIPILSHVISQIDVNCNLDILTEGEQWKRELWFELFSSEEFLNLDKLSTLREGPVKRKKIDADFVCWFPFSSAILNKMTSIIDAHFKAAQSNEPVIRNVLQQTRSGRILLQLSPRQIRCYLRDLVYIEYDVNDEEHELIVTSIFTRAIRKKNKDGEIPMDIVDIHLIVSSPAFRQRIRCFLQIVSQREGITADLRRLIGDADDIMIDALALERGLRTLYPTLEDILDEQGRFTWTSNVQQIKLAANQLLNLPESYPNEFSTKAMEVLQTASITWTQIQLFKIFFEHVCPPGISCLQKDVTAALNFLEDLNDIKDALTSEESWKEVEQALQHLDFTANSVYQNHGDENPICRSCNESLDDPIQFPCLHVTCFNCASQLIENEEKKCSLCQAVIPDDFDITEEKRKRELLYELGPFKQRCISFFMEAVSAFCFSSTNRSIDQKVFELMMSYVTTESQQTKEMSPFADYGVDSTPTVRSFLVQQLLKARGHGQRTEEYLQRYLDESNYAREDDKESRLELCLLLVHCYEDFKMAEISNSQRLDSMLELLCSRIDDNKPEELKIENIETLRIVADYRVFVIKAAEIAYQDKIENKFGIEYREKLSKLYSLMQSHCMDVKNLREFFLRQLIRSYGNNAMQALVAQNTFNWLWPEEKKEENNMLQDKFIIYGDAYKELRENIGEAAMKGDVTELSLASQEEDEPMDDSDEVFALLALYREITTQYLKQAPDAKFCDDLLECLHSKGIVTSQQKIAKMLIQNQQGNGFDKFTFSPQLDQQDAELAEVVIHTHIALSINSSNLLLQPLALFMVSPRDMKNAYLPTMPDDHLADAFDAGADGKWQMYQCPNGHSYAITECGQPYQQFTCPDCHAIIGGANHVAASGNLHAQRVDRTQTGYVLGDPNSRLDFPVAERHLQSASHSLLSVLLHSALLIGACNDQNAVADIIDPQTRVTDVRQFVWEHLRVSVKILAKAIGRSVEDALILVHLVLQSMLNGDNINTDGTFGSLGSKECRRQWEETFNIRYIVPFLSTLGQTLNSTQKEILDDRRLGGSNPLIRRLYELDVNEGEDDLERHAFDYVRFWRYRIPITVTHLQSSLNEFMAKKRKSTCQILKNFLEKEEILRLVKNLPDIVRLQNILSRNLSQKLSSESAKTEKIKAVVSQYFKGTARKEVEKLLKIYYATWRALKPTLLTLGELSQANDLELSSNSPIGYLLPSMKEHGRRALLFVECLARAHNDIVMERRTVQGDQTEIKNVPIQEATFYDLVAYDHDVDLIPMLYAHCSYSLEIGKGTIIDYNFIALERQLVTTFISGKPMLDVGVSTMKYADDVNDLEKFKELEKRVEQRQIPFADQLQMAAEFHGLPEVCDALRAAEITIGFLSSTGADANYFYKKFLEDIRMQPSIFLVSGKMQSVCRLAHIRSIWKMLTVERAYMMHVSGEDPFDLNDMFRTEIDDFDGQILRSVDVEHLLAELTEYIVLEVPRRDANSIDMSLQECLEIFMDMKNSFKKAIKGADHLPSSICLKQIYSFWMIVANARKTFKTRG